MPEKLTIAGQGDVEQGAIALLRLVDAAKQNFPIDHTSQINGRVVEIADESKVKWSKMEKYEALVESRLPKNLERQEQMSNLPAMQLVDPDAMRHVIDESQRKIDELQEKAEGIKARLEVRKRSGVSLFTVQRTSRISKGNKRRKRSRLIINKNI